MLTFPNCAIAMLSLYTVDLSASDDKGTSRMQPYLGGSFSSLYVHVKVRVLFPIFGKRKP